MSTIEAKQLNRFWIDEAPTGTINGSNVTFTLSQEPIENDAVELYLNGIYLTYTTDYTISGTTITMVAAPVVGQVLRASYIQKSGGA